MKEYHFTFFGKTVGAIGASSSYSKTVESDSLENAILKLYDTHEHISQLRIWNGTEYYPVAYMNLGAKEGRVL